MLKSTLLLASLLPLITSFHLPKPNPTHFLSHPLTPFLTQAASDNSTAAILCKSVTMTNVTQDERTHSDSIRTSVRSLRNGNPLVDFIQGPDSSDKFTSKYVEPLGYVAAPWFALLGISVITFLILLLNCCCTFGCGRNSQTKPISKTSKFKKCLVITSIITAIGLFAFCIYGINVSSDFTKGGNQTMCQAGILVDQLVEGSNGDHWIGLRSMVNKLLVTIDNFDSTGINLNYATGTTDIALINTKYTTDTQSLTLMYNNNKASTVNRPDPAIGGTYQPDYIKNLGPSSTATTQTGKILTEMQNKKTIVTQASQDITTSIAQIKAGVVITIQTLQDAEQSAQNAAYSVNNMTVEVQSGGSDAQDFIRGFGKGLFALFLSEILTSAVAVVSMGFAIFGILALNKLLHCSWCLISIFMITGWVLAAILFPLSVVLVESCEVGEKVITNQTFFNQTFDKFLSNPNYTQSREMLYTCLYGDGDVLTTLGIRSTLSVFETLFDALDNTANLTESIQPVTDSYEIPSQLAQVAQLQVGYISDASETNTDLNTLNSLTNSKTNTCTKVQDFWILNSANCTTASGSVFASSSAADFNLYNPTCIGYDAWGSKTVNQRYNTGSFPQPSCGSIGGNTEDVALGNLVNGFVTARGQVNNIFKSVKTDLGTVQTANADYMTAIKSATSNIAPVRDQSKVIYQALGDKNEGIFKNSDCRFIKESIETLHDVMCVRFVSGAYETSVALTVISFIAIFGASILFCLAKRNSREIDANDHGNKEDYFRVQAQ